MSAMKSPTLSQMLLNPKQGSGAFMYPSCQKTCDTIQDDHNSPLVERQAHDHQTTPVSAPLHRSCKSSSKSLGMRRRFRSIENSASPSLTNRTLKRVFNKTSENPAKRIKPESDAILKVSTRNVLYGTAKNPSSSSSETFNLQSMSCKTSLGFKTAGNKCINISRKAMQNAEKIFAKLETEFVRVDKLEAGVDKLEVNLNKTGVVALPVTNYGDNTRDPGLSHCAKCNKPKCTCNNIENSSRDGVSIGFKTASNKNIKISETAMNRASRIFEQVFNEENNSVKDPCHRLTSVDKSWDEASRTTEKGDELILSTDAVKTNCVRSNVCTSPVLQNKRSARKRLKIFKNTLSKNGSRNHVPLTDSTETIEKNTDCPLLNDGLDLELLAVDLNEKFEKEYGGVDSKINIVTSEGNS